MENPTQKSIRRGARIYIVRSFAAPILMASLYFLSAGSLDFPRAWFYFALFLLLSVTVNGILYIKNPELLYHRNHLKSDAKGWDKILMPAAIFSGFHLQCIIMGLDARFAWSTLAPEYMIPGFIIYVLSFSFSTWAMRVNQHFEANVRIQKDRNHKVISSGPYKFVRHPGYLAFIFGTVSVPLIIGSLFGLINAFIGSLLILIRTAKEDDTLKNELKGYQAYIGNVKYRLFPGLW